MRAKPPVPCLGEERGKLLWVCCPLENLQFWPWRSASCCCSTSWRVKCSRCPTTGLARGIWNTGQYQALTLGWCKKGHKSQVRPWDGHPGSQVLGKTETPGEKVRLAPWMGWSQAGLVSCSVLLVFHTEFLGA